MPNTLYNTIIKNKIIKESTDFIKKLQQVAKYQKENQKENSTQQEKGSFYEKNTNGEKLQALTLKNQFFTNCIFNSSEIIRCSFQNCVFTNCSFSGCNLFNVKFKECNLTSCDFTSTNMQDVDASTSRKNNCKFGDIDTSKNVKGFDEKDKNIITDQTQNQNIIATANNIKSCMQQYFTNWELCDDQISYKKEFPNEINVRIVLQKNNQKQSSTQNQDYWNITLYFGQNNIFTTEFNLFGKPAEDIKTIIQNWINDVLVDNAEDIIKNMIKLLIEEKK